VTTIPDTSRLETAADPAKLRRVAIDPLSRVEGHGTVTLLLDESGHVHQARLHIVEFRGFERFIQGRPYWEVPTLVQRLCGICPVSHLLAASKACDHFVIGDAPLTPAALKLRRLLHYGQTLQSHALHFFHLGSPDLLFGFDDDPAHRNIAGVIQDHPEVAIWGIRIRKFGQEIIRILTGKRIHGTGSVPGGFNTPLSAEDRDHLLKSAEQIVGRSHSALDGIRGRFLARQPEYGAFGLIRSNFLSIVRADGALELYDGGFRVKDPEGRILLDHFDPKSYAEIIREEVKNWTYMKFPYLVSLGPDHGWYRVGPLARVNNCDFIPTPLAETARREFMSFGGGRPVHAPLAFHWARMIETLHCAEAIVEMLEDPGILGTELMASGTPALEGIGVVEAPRGTLFHHYNVNAQGTIAKANLIVATTGNNRAMNESVRSVAAKYFDGRAITEGLLNRIEVAIRAYDPCLSCATHAVGRMPLIVEVVDAAGRLVDRMVKSHSGELTR
jgi:NAD-reducing hydrogenase large subunit